MIDLLVAFVQNLAGKSGSSNTAFPGAQRGTLRNPSFTRNGIVIRIAGTAPGIALRQQPERLPAAANAGPASMKRAPSGAFFWTVLLRRPDRGHSCQPLRTARGTMLEIGVRLVKLPCNSALQQFVNFTMRS
jgi:hypothetical protein